MVSSGTKTLFLFSALLHEILVFWVYRSKIIRTGRPLKLDALKLVDGPIHSLTDRLVVLCFRKRKDRLPRWMVVALKIENVHVGADFMEMVNNAHECTWNPAVHDRSSSCYLSTMHCFDGCYWTQIDFSVSNYAAPAFSAVTRITVSWPWWLPTSPLGWKGI